METVRAAGHRFDPSAVLLDPYATAILSRRQYGQLGSASGRGNDGLAEMWPQCAAALPLPAAPEFDWEGDRPLNLPMETLVSASYPHARAILLRPCLR